MQHSLLHILLNEKLPENYLQQEAKAFFAQPPVQQKTPAAAQPESAFPELQLLASVGGAAAGMMGLGCLLIF